MTATIISTTPPVAESNLSQVAEAARTTMARRHIPGMSLAVTGADGLLFSAGFGSADLARGVPMAASTPVLWFSLTKIATATAAMHLFDQGLLDIDEPISAHFSGYRTASGGTPTMRQLLSHTAGAARPIPIRWVRPADQPAPDPSAFLDQLLSSYGTARYPVGGPARYSNLGYLIAAEVVGRVAGRPFTDVVTDSVLRPLAMHDTAFEHSHAVDTAVGYLRMPAIATRVVRRVLPDGIVGERVGEYTALRPFLVNGAGYGGLVGTVTDAVRLAAMHLGDGTFDGRQILRPETAREMRRISSPGKPFDVGLGWFRRSTVRDATAVEHLGAGGGFYNAMRIYPDLGLGIVAMANCTNSWDHDSLFDAVAALDWGAGR